MQSKFKSYNEYIEWRAHWRKQYREVSDTLRRTKTEARKPTNNTERVKVLMSTQRSLQMTARSMMMARESVETYRKVRAIARIIDVLTA